MNTLTAKFDITECDTHGSVHVRNYGEPNNEVPLTPPLFVCPPPPPTHTHTQGFSQDFRIGYMSKNIHLG